VIAAAPLEPRLSKCFVLNADDYALHKPGDDAIISLAEQGIVTSTTAMVLSPQWPEAAKRLLDCPIDAGVHLDFTSEFAVPPAGRTVTATIAQCWSRTMKSDDARTAIERQLDRFESAMGAAPVVIDGHEHVHQFPVIRYALFDAIEARYANCRPMLRSCATRRFRGIKAAMIAALGSSTFACLAARRGFRTNDDFAGVYDFDESANLPSLWRDWLSGAYRGGLLVMCHVSTGAQSLPGDPIQGARLREYEWLRSTEFKTLCAKHGEPVRWRDLPRDFAVDAES
jgi:chitin disaccharide deacetylase